MDKITSWYDNWHRKNGVNSWRVRRWYRHYIDLLPIYGDRFLDVGCGVGNLLYHAADVFDECHGVDISGDGLMIALRNAPNATLHRRNGCDLSNFPDGYFDCVVNTGAIEHFPDIDKALSEMHRVGKHDATFLIVVPNSLFPLNLIKGGTIQEEIGETIKTSWAWARQFEAAGFRVVLVKADTYHAETKSFGWLLRLLPTAFSYVLEFVLVKK